MSKVNKKSKANIGRIFTETAPFIGLIVSTVVFQILTKGRLLSFENLQNLTNQVIITALVAIGATFIFGIGNFDISLGAIVCITAVLGGLVAIATGSLLMAFIVCVLTSLLIGILKGMFASYVEVPFFIFTIILAVVVNAVVLMILGKETTIYLEDAAAPIKTFSFSEMTLINVFVLGGFYLLCYFMFKYTSLGTKVKILGGSQATARQTGINITKMNIISFVISAIGIALAAFLIIIRVRTVGHTTATSTGNDVIVALVLGGMPLSGGPRTKISAGIVGAATITILNSGLAIMGLSTGAIQIFRGIVFLAVVFLASYSYRTKMLPR